MEFRITKQLLEKLAGMVDLNKLQNDQVPETFKYQNKSYIPVMSSSSQDKGIIWVSCYELIPLEKYNGHLEPKCSYDHHNLVIAGKREKVYDSRLLKSGSKKFVLIGPPVYFIPAKEEKQLNIF
jgi:hypothetical protein